MGQLSHKGLTSELLSDMRKDIADSLDLDKISIQPEFAGGKTVDLYLNRCATRPVPDSLDGLDSIQITSSDLQLSINRKMVDSVWNSTYVRQLELDVIFQHENQEFHWKGKISDKLSVATLKKLLDEEYPMTIHGDFSTDEPGIPLLVLTTLSVFTLVAALFFIRT